jgi:hypothetical protein
MLRLLSQVVVHGRLADFFHHIFISKTIQSARGNPEQSRIIIIHRILLASGGPRISRISWLVDRAFGGVSPRLS